MMKYTRKQWLWGLGITGPFILLAIGIAIYYAYWWVQKQPVLNPQPKHFLVIHGHVDPPAKIAFATYYFTYNEDCNVYVNFLEGAIGARERDFFYKVHIKKNGDYRIRIPLDKLQKGYCRWKIAQVSYGIANNATPKNDDSLASILGFDFSKKTIIKNPKVKIVCNISSGFPGNLNCSLGSGNFDYLNSPASLKSLSMNFIIRKKPWWK